MRYLSVCSGIEAASVAWHPLGWEPVAFSEIEAFPSAVLSERWPHVPNWGDMERYVEWPDADVDLLVGGTPCQSFSVAGLRKGLADPRGNLALTYLAIADRNRPRWLLWENVPGVLSSDEGRDFGALVGAMVELGYGVFWRVLDAQFVRVDGLGRAVPQRRRRVFLVGYLGDWRRAAAVLLEPEGMPGNPPPRRQAGQGIAAGAIKGAAIGRRPENGPQRGDTVDDGSCFTLTTNEVHAVAFHGDPHGRMDLESETLVAHALRAEGFDASEDGIGRGTPLVPIAFTAQDYGADAGETAPTLRAGGYAGSHANAGCMPAVTSGLSVRRLTPRECERLQGFPDGYTDVPYGRRNWTPDGPRYKALGNSMAVNAMRWIGRRIDMVEQLSAEMGLDAGRAA